MCCSVLLSVRGVSLYLYVSIGGGGWLPWLPLPLRQTDSYYVLYTFLLNVLKKGCWGGGGLLGYSDIYRVAAIFPEHIQSFAVALKICSFY